MSTATQTHKYTRTAIVTGAAQGIGRGISLRLAADGLDVAVADLPSQINALNAVVAEIQQLGRKAVAVIADVSKEDEVKALVETTVSSLGRLDMMVANAGIVNGPGGVVSIMDANVENWQKGWDVNLRGTLLCYQYAARQMIKQGAGGRIIGYVGLGGYCILKAAIRSMTQTTGKHLPAFRPTLELREHNVTVNSYAPGAIDTNMSACSVWDLAHLTHTTFSVANPLDKEHGTGFGIKQVSLINESLAVLALILRQLLKLGDVRTGTPTDVDKQAIWPCLESCLCWDSCAIPG
ncbi:hypothetical protein B0H14DRAFT_2378350 [Mycena olivaceomarginata]|nr:hypothetical protein B0H14DRAFT_2378350 [Mycena olivaceomarginata]